MQQELTMELPGGRWAFIVEDEVLVKAWQGDALGQLSPAPQDHPVRAALAAYAAGDVTALDELAVRQPGSEFFQRVWEEMRRIPGGTTLSYAGLAALAGRPKAVRAVGAACARNQIPLVVPCHRVLSQRWQPRRLCIWIAGQAGPAGFRASSCLKGTRERSVRLRLVEPVPELEQEQCRDLGDGWQRILQASRLPGTGCPAPDGEQPASS